MMVLAIGTDGKIRKVVYKGSKVLERPLAHIKVSRDSGLRFLNCP